MTLRRPPRIIGGNTSVRVALIAYRISNAILYASLLSEDFQSERRYEDIQIVDPLEHSAAEFTI